MNADVKSRSETNVSDAPPSPEIGPNTTKSWPRSTKEKGSLAERWEEALGKLHLAGQLVGMESIRRGMNHEDSLAMRDAEAYHQALHGDRAGEKGEEDGMGHLVLGDMVTQYIERVPDAAPPSPPAPPTPTPASPSLPTSAEIPTAFPAKTLWQKAKPYVLGAGLTAAGVAFPYLGPLISMLGPSVQPPVQPPVQMNPPQPEEPSPPVPFSPPQKPSDVNTELNVELE